MIATSPNPHVRIVKHLNGNLHDNDVKNLKVVRVPTTKRTRKKQTRGDRGDFTIPAGSIAPITFL